MLFLSSVDECSEDLHNCHSNASCSNIGGSFNCSCLPGYQGNGTFCENGRFAVLCLINSCHDDCGVYSSLLKYSMENSEASMRSVFRISLSFFALELAFRRKTMCEIRKMNSKNMIFS